MTARTVRLLAGLLGGLAVMSGLLWALPLAQAQTAGAAPGRTPAASIRYVRTDGQDSGDCASMDFPCRTPQYAVDRAAEGDEVRLAAGVYSGVQARAGITQTLYLSKTLSVSGGWDSTFASSRPDVYLTMLDAGGMGRGVVITGTVTPMLAGLRVTGGASDRYGGGIYVVRASPTITFCAVFSNSAAYGGGIFLDHSPAQLLFTAVMSNSAQWHGGGLYLSASPAVLKSSLVLNNQALAGEGGGLYLQQSSASITSSAVSQNSAAAEGGGLYLMSSAAAITTTSVTFNSALSGAGLYLNGSPASLQADEIRENSAATNGGGIYLSVSDAELSGSTVRSNHATGNGSRGAGIYADGGRPIIQNNTLDHNTAPLAGWGGGLSLHDGIFTIRNNTITANAAGYAGGGLDLSGAAPITVSGNTIEGNTAGTLGGGLYVSSDGTVFDGNTLTGNVVTNGFGGGLYYTSSGARGLTGTGNTLTGNQVAGAGGGMFLYGGVVQLDGTKLAGNQANGSSGAGGGLYLYTGRATFTNLLVADNAADSMGSGMYVDVATATLYHTTIVRNIQGDGVGLRAGHRFDASGVTTVTLTNTIVARQNLGIAAGPSDNVRLAATLWGAAGTDWFNNTNYTDGVVAGAPDYIGDPRFMAPGDYRLRPGSAAIDHGLPTNVVTDLDGRVRPNPATGIPDLGSYEWYQPAMTYLPFARR